MGINYREIFQQYPEINSLQEGEEVHVNHVGCTAGADSKARLYIKRDGGSLLFYCHHCNLGGKLKAARNHIRGRGQANEISTVLALPHDLVCRRDMMNVHADVWLNKAGLTQEERDRYFIGWSERYGRVIIPVHNPDGELVAFQRRRVLPHDKLPKYLTTRRTDTPHPVWMGKTLHDTHRIVIVEDILSGVKVNRVENSLALLTTSMPEWLLWYIVGHFDHAVIWLDNDNPAVNKAGRTIKKRLCQFMESVKIVRGHADPKHYSTDDIRNVLTSLQ